MAECCHATTVVCHLAFNTQKIFIDECPPPSKAVGSCHLRDAGKENDTGSSSDSDSGNSSSDGNENVTDNTLQLKERCSVKSGKVPVKTAGAGKRSSRRKDVLSDYADMRSAVLESI